MLKISALILCLLALFPVVLFALAYVLAALRPDRIPEGDPAVFAGEA